MGIFEQLQSSNLVQDVSDADAAAKLGKGDKFYVGFDPTAESLQVGNLVPLIVSIKLARAGLEPFILFGGSTGGIGDPSGRSTERSSLLERDTIDKNISRQTQQVKNLFSSVNVTPTFINNYDWTKNVDVLSFLRDVGKHFTVNYMIAKEVVKNRLAGDGISFTEFSYMLLQAFDFLHLYQNHNVRMQIGGSDQWGNITAGLELIRRKLGETNALAFSIPLLTNSEGLKFGKSAASGTIWLDPNMTSAYQFHQFWLNTPDADVIRYLKIFSFLESAEIEELNNATISAPQERAAQKILADSVTKLVHGEAALELAKKSANVLFGGSLEGLKDNELLEIFKDVPSSILATQSCTGLTVADFVVQAQAVKSKGEAKRLVAGGGLYINGNRVSSETALVTDFFTGKVVVIRTGKKNFFLVNLN